jgi:ketosteroid isomerase-like protein
VIEEETAGRLDFPAFRRAIERSDAEALLGFYAEDAGLRVANADAPHGPAFELRGRAEIEKYLHAVCDQGMSCAVEDESVEEGRVCFGQRCVYEDGTRVFVRTTLGFRGGKILRQLDVVEHPP